MQKIIITSTPEAAKHIADLGYQTISYKQVMQEWLDNDTDLADTFIPDQSNYDGKDVVFIPNTNDLAHTAITQYLFDKVQEIVSSARILHLPNDYKTVESWQPTKQQIDDLLDDCRFRVISFSDMLALEMRMDWVIKDYVGKESMCQLFGSSGSGKSFFALDMGYCVAAGISFFGKKTKQGNVLYVAGEGFHGLKKRAVALQNKYNAIIKDSFDFSRQAAQLLSLDSCIELSDRIKLKPGGYDLVIIDTLNRNFGAGDENSTQDMTTFVQNIDTYIRSLGCAVIIVHHTGLQNKERARGSGALYNAIDSEFRIEKDDNHAMLITCTKNKEGASAWSESMHLRTTIVGYDDEEQEDIVSCYIDRPTIGGHEVMPKRQQIVLEALKQCLLDAGIMTTNGLCVTIEEWRNASRAGLNDQNYRRDFIKYSKKLIEDGVVLQVENEVFLNV